MQKAIVEHNVQDTTLNLNIDQLSVSKQYAKEIKYNQEQGDGGALNADHRTVEAIIEVANILGKHGIMHRDSFVFVGRSIGTITFKFRDKKITEAALGVLKRYVPINKSTMQIA